MGAPCAIGRLEAGGPWIGFVEVSDGYRLAVGAPSGMITAPADDDVLLALAITYFDDALDEPPPNIEATHADLSELVRHVAATVEDAGRRRLLAEAVDAIDDGLAVDAVINRLAAARRAATEQADPLDLLRDRVRELLARGA